MPRITASSPVLLVHDIMASANYYRDCLGFHYDGMYGEPPCFCICERDGHFLMLALVDAETPVTPIHELREDSFSAYYWVDDVEALYRQFVAAGAKIRLPPETLPYGVREVGVEDPDGHWINFGQILR